MSTGNVLVLGEIVRGELAEITHELVTAARSVAGAQAVVLLPGARAARHAEALVAADRVVVFDDPQLDDYSPESFLAALAEMVAAEQPRAVLIGATSIGWDIAPLLAARIQAPLVTGCRCIAADGERLRVTASFCGGKMMADVVITDAPAILMVQPGAFRTAGRGSDPTGLPNELSQVQIETRRPAVPLAPGAITLEEFVLPESADVDITQEAVLVAVGRGIQQQDNLEMAEELAAALGGAVCASRPVVDQGWLPATRQVGKSGMTVKPKLYLALGISGAPEHQEGMKSADLVIAVNTDPQAPIFDVAQYGAELDLLDLLPALTAAIQARKG